MIVVSLFDGMSCGQLALDELGIKPDRYFAAEIKDHAIKCSKHNFPETIHLGDVKKIRYENGVLYSENGQFEVPKVDLFIGGSPCQDLSSLMRNRQGLKGQKSSLFYEYLRIKQELNPKYFLLENVATMKADDKEIINELMGVDGFFIDSKYFSAQMRKRFYWTNINFDKNIIDKKIMLSDILESGFTSREKSVCVVRNYAGSVQSSNKDSFIRMCNQRAKKGFLTVVYEEKDNPDSVRLFTKKELERLQTVRSGYTDCLTYKETADLIGDGWTIDVIKHIFEPLKKEY